MLRSAGSMLEMLDRFGLRVCARQATYRLRRRMGRLQKQFAEGAWPSPAGRALSDWQDGRGGPFFFDGLDGRGDGIDGEARDTLLEQADAVAAGRFRYFSHTDVDAGMPPDWFRNPFTGQRCPGSRHWCEIDDFAPDQGDIKFIYELSRFGWVFLLARAYAVSGREKYPQTFWRLWEDWREHNPPHRGPNWKCGQECACRLMALGFGLFAFAGSPSTTTQRAGRLIAAIGVHAERIRRNIDFALSLKNSHGISEAAGLYTAGLLFPGLRGATEWRKRGRECLIAETMRQIYRDGSYVQHSMNYERLALHDLVWAGRLAELNGEPLPDDLIERLRAATQFMLQMVDGQTGRVPNYGPNDGVSFLQLDACDYLDYRPVIQCLSYLASRELLFGPGPWDEPVAWLFGANALDAARAVPRRSTFGADVGGYYVLRDDRSWAMIRCHTYRDRPLQSDMLHLDLWHDGINLLRDGGSYQYFSDPPWEHYFKSTAAHNTVELDSTDQMDAAGRFRWAHWTRCTVRHHEVDPAGPVCYWEGEHYGYRRLPCRAVHRRAVLAWRGRWVVVDDILGCGTVDAVLRWRLADLDWESAEGQGAFRASNGVGLALWTGEGVKPVCEVKQGEERPRPEGWESLYYGERLPVPTVVCRSSGTLPIRFVTLIDCDGRAEWHISEDRIESALWGPAAAVRLSPPDARAGRVAVVDMAARA